MSTTEKDIAGQTQIGASGLVDEATNEQVAQSEAVTDEKEQTARLRLEDKVLRYFQNKEIAKERNEENKLLLEEIEELFAGNEEEEITISLPSGEIAVLSPQFREREVLDKDALAEELQVAKDDLKTPFDFCMFTSQGKLTPAMVTKYTSVEREVKLRISKRKRNTKRRKRKGQSADEPQD
ncbi:hypothetical protein [Alicyclobacillus acidoterrestris]|uniref:Uncharacterized protein n=1 Tax=Alicyclobacillus acidoterrestris (strain ATCC 49025 / DSM 3922 / CIP 106132 / NCIMB 13137 / GD3B) TaxID=1356854 RepID=T0D147_ALIAG|nr:hypothetical protein [Alicyclobacillus acidoterrestris]EPZ43496.1 hypothetical protein N007_12370 [Alicyclobacillus acidoterrestris ATCC 49025]UNO50179.1 hypothetical protein K1I37_06805 [Alicyclobacillus acidoterrestris]